MPPKASAARSQPAKGADKGAKKESKPRKTRKVKGILDMPLDSDDEEVGEAEDVTIDWKDPDLTWSLLNAITDNAEIKQGLFPSPGGETRPGKAKPKADHHLALATVLFSGHPKYQKSFLSARSATDKAAWTRKIKNRLSNLIKLCRQYTTEMGETGAGITREDEIDMSLKNEFTTKWGLIQQSFPWYWTLKELISERPNCTPVGLGNTSTGFDVDILQDQQPGSDNDENVSDNNNSSSAPNSDNDDTHSSPPSADCHPQKRTKAKPSTSKPAAVVPNKKAKTAHNKFADIALKEEETAQALMKIKEQKVRAALEVDLARIQAKAQIRIRQEELKAQLRATREQRMYEYRVSLASNQAGSSSGFRVPLSNPFDCEDAPSFPDFPSSDNDLSFQGSNANFFA